MEFDILIEEDRWTAVGLERLCARAGRALVDVLDLSSDHEVSVLAASDDRIAQLNAEFRGKPAPTNVLSWPSIDLSAERPGDTPDLARALPELGDIALSYGVCTTEAQDAGKPLEDHVTHLIVHGLMHLLGFDHLRDKDAALMEGLESRILAALDIADPYHA